MKRVIIQSIDCLCYIIGFTRPPSVEMKYLAFVVQVRELKSILFRSFPSHSIHFSFAPYSKSKLLGIAPPLNKGLTLSSDPRFKRSNEMLNAKVVSLKRHGKENLNATNIFATKQQIIVTLCLKIKCY